MNGKKETHQEGDCPFKGEICHAAEAGLKGCIFHPFFEMYKTQHDESAQLFREMTVEASKALQRQTSELFKIVKGSNGVGLTTKVAKLETKLGFYIVIGSAGAGVVIQTIMILAPFLFKKLIG